MTVHVPGSPDVVCTSLVVQEALGGGLQQAQHICIVLPVTSQVTQGHCGSWQHPELQVI